MHTDAKNATRKSVILKKKRLWFVFLVWCAHSQKLSDQWDWRFCSRVWSCWSYSKTQLRGAQTQNSLAEHTYVTTKKIYSQVASTLPASFLIQQNNNFFIAGAAGASGAWNIHVFFVWFWQARKYLLSSSEVTSECQKRKVAQRHLVYRGISVLH